MLKEMYKRRERMAYLFLMAILIAVAAWVIFQPPETAYEWMGMLFFLFPIALVASVIIISRSHFNRIKEIEIPESNKRLLDLQDIVIKRDAAFIPRLLLFEKSGQFVGSVEMAKISWWMYPILVVDSSLLVLFPMTYEFIGHDDKRPIIFRKTGWLKQSRVDIFSGDHQKLGTYIQEELKAIINIRGILYNEREEQLLSLKASGFSGSFSWSDGEGRRWAYFYNGMFPHEYTNLFRDTHNDIVEMSNELSDDDKSRLLAVIGFIFFTRIKQ